MGIELTTETKIEEIEPHRWMLYVRHGDGMWHPVHAEWASCAEVAVTLIRNRMDFLICHTTTIPLPEAQRKEGG